MTLNKQALREAAEKATPGPWEMEQENIWYTDAEGYTKHLMYAQQGDDVDDRQDHYNTAFIATANPSTVLALLDELDAAEKLIAELEGNEIREEGNQFLVVRHPGKAPVIKHCAGDLDEYLRKLIESDPLVTIDIITHRYYGVGGQWVQDADEYLHVAGIKIKGE